jgi:serine protease inhibitor
MARSGFLECNTHRGAGFCQEFPAADRKAAAGALRLQEQILPGVGMLKQTGWMAALVVGSVVLTGCEGLLGPGKTAGEGRLEALPRALTVQEREVIEASNGFAFDILRETVLDQPAQNILLSPLSASLALGMTMNGAVGETQDGMKAALGFGGRDMAGINEAYRGLIDLLLGLDRGVDMRIANSIWARQGFPFRESFYETARRYFDAEVTVMDFGSADAASRIDDWVKAKTGGRIDRIAPDPIPALAVMYLVNAVYFKADWTHQFDRRETVPAPFRLENGGTKTVPMMRRTGRLLVHYDGTIGAHVVELPYGRGAFAMTLVLPAANADLDAFLASLTQERWNGWLAGLNEVEAMLGLPRFRVEYETAMNEPLIALGMGMAFGREPGTDFSGLSPAGRDLFISLVKQKTFIEVNEEGTEAAAATLVEISRTSGPPSITFDRPFVLAIRERLSGTIMFIGRIGDPQ